ncbi:hypothetical protein VNO77_16607 [Canavalia gladiata]|uniref:FAS1 domain-containing protein n=1 Tax=Canavalia gladiata TaxID=3824 RepID=A0AAN9QLV2_CANGL
MEEIPITLLLLLTLTFFLFPTVTVTATTTTTTTTTTISTESLFSLAAQTLIDSGYLSMALTLRLASPALPATATATIFVPSDTAFLLWGPLPLTLLQYHILPFKLPLQYLITSNPLPTLLPNSSLTYTSFSLSPHHLSINNVTVNTTPIFHSPSLLMLSLHRFFNSSSLLLPHSNTQHLVLRTVSDILKSNGCSVTAAFLETLLTEFTDGAHTKLMVFAPVDESVRNVNDYYAILRKHVVPRLITWHDLIRLPDETLLPTLSEGFAIRVTVSPRLRLLNGVPVAVPDVYRSNLLVVHRVDRLLDNSTV